MRSFPPPGIRTLGGPCLAALCLFLPPSLSWGWSQSTGTVLGRITDVSTGEPLAGAVVQVAPGGPGVLSGDEGWYFLTGIPEGRRELTIDLLGFAPVAESIQVLGGEAGSLDFQLRPEAIALDELLVSVERGEARSLGHRTVISQERIQDPRPNSMSELLQGLVPGVVLTTTSGQAGASRRVRIRGVRSLQESLPLFFMDGVRVGSARIQGPPGTSQTLAFLDSIHPRDVQRIEIIRNPEATLLYGADARGGVILIFTKKGGVSDSSRSLLPWPGVPIGGRDLPKAGAT